MKLTQINWVADQLTEHGYVSRNEALRKNITRLAARINDLKQVGWEIQGYRHEKDYRYKLEKA